MDVKGAKALSERLAEAARNVDPLPAKAVDSGDSDRLVTQTAEVADDPLRVDPIVSCTTWPPAPTVMP